MFTCLYLFNVNGTHTSEDMPPQIPFFTGLKTNRTPRLTQSATTGALETPQPQANPQGLVDLGKKVCC